MRNSSIRNVPVTDSVRYASRQIWLAGLGAAAMTRDWAESGAAPMFRALVKEGTLVEARTFRQVGDRLERSFTKANSAWRRARAAVQTGMRDAAGSAVALVQSNLPKSLPSVKLPSMLRAKPARKVARKRVAKTGTKARTASPAKRGVRGKARTAK